MPQSQIQFPNVAVRNNIASGVLELFFLDVIYDTYDWWTGESENVVEEVISKVKAANPKTVKLTIDSEGGDAGIGIAVYNFLKNYPVEVEVEIIGMAGSIASVLAMCASPGKLLIARNAFEVIHKAWGGGWGNSSDLREAADVIDRYTEQIVDIYSQRTGKTADEINAMIDKGDYWMTGREAVELGFADALLEENDNFKIAARVQNLSNHYRNIPEEIKKPASTTEDNNEQDESSNSFINNTLMDLKKGFETILNTLKGKKIDTASDNIGEQVANMLQDSVGEIAQTVQDEVTNDLTAMKTTIMDEIKAEYGTKIETLEKANATLLKENGELKNQVAEEAGKESNPGTKNENTPAPIGKGAF